MIALVQCVMLTLNKSSTINFYSRSIVTADIGILMGANTSFMAICEKYGIPIVKGLPTHIYETIQPADTQGKQHPSLFRVDGWDAIAKSGLLS